MVRLPGSLWSTDDDLQSLRSLGAAWHMGKSVPRACWEWTSHRHADDRLHTRQGPPLGIGRKRGEQKQAVGRSRGGRNTKIHALADAKGRLIAILLTGGEAHDCPFAERLIRRGKVGEAYAWRQGLRQRRTARGIGSARNQADHSKPQQQEATVPLQQAPLQASLAHRSCIQQAQGLPPYRNAL